MIDSVGKMTNRFKPIKRTLKELIDTLSQKIPLRRKLLVIAPTMKMLGQGRIRYD